MIMKGIIIWIAICLAALAVILLAIVSPLPHRNPPKATSKLALSLYIQQPHVNNDLPTTEKVPSSDASSVAAAGAGALIFHRVLTEGPEDTSRVVGKAQGFIIPLQHFAHSAFNIIYLTFNTHEYSGSISIEAKNLAGDHNKDKEELSVVGGTGSFAFARGVAVFVQPSDVDATYHVKLDLKFPSRSKTIPG